MDVNLIIQKAIVREGLSNLNIENIQPCYIKGIIKTAIEIAISTHIPLQKCSKCDGQGIVSKPLWVAIDECLPKETYGDYMICLENNSIFKANYSRIGHERWLIVGIGYVNETNPVKYWAEIHVPPIF